MHLLTRTGALDLTDPSSYRFTLAEIGHALGRINRWTGHTREPISVAQHSARVEIRVMGHGPTVRAQALFHDSAEAYIGDVSIPVRAALGSAIEEIEARVHSAICARFGIPAAVPRAVVLADIEEAQHESACLAPIAERPTYAHWTPAAATSQWLACVRALGIED